MSQKPDRLFDVVQWQQVFESADFCLALSDVATERFVSVNSAFATQLGYQPEELADASIFTIYAPEVHDQVRELLVDLDRKGHIVYESIHIRKDGSRFPVRVEATIFRDSHGCTAFRVSTSTDISIQRMQAERFIRYMRCQNAQLKLYAAGYSCCNELLDSALEEAVALTESCVGYIFIYEEDSRLLTLYAWSHAVASSFTAQVERGVWELDGIGLWGEAIRQRKPIITNDYVADNPLKKNFPECSLLLERYVSLPIMRSNRIVALVGVGNKEQPYTEDDVRQLQLFMGGCWNVLERLKARDELMAVKELAESSARVKGELLANISHELRTPLNGILGGTQLMALTDLTPEQQTYLEMIEVSSAHELSLITSLLDLVSLESEGIQVAEQLFSLVVAVEDVIKHYRSVASEKGLRLLLDIAPLTPEQVIGDSVRIRQILHSLVGNAIKFTDQGDVIVNLSVVVEENGAALVRLTVSDTGVGIAAEQQKLIFDILTQSDMSNTRQHGGLGLGLAICNRLVAALGGRIWVESTLSLGSTFKVELPIIVVTNERQWTQDFSVLLVENDHLSALTATGLLRKMGLAVTVAVDAYEGLSIWQRQSFDLVLMDIQMPKLSGFEAVQKIRQVENEQGRKRTPVVAQTVYARRNFHESFLGAGFDGLISKPLMRADLEETIKLFCR